MVDLAARFAPVIRSTGPDAEARSLVFFGQNSHKLDLPNAHVLATRRSPCLSRLNFRPFRLQPPHRHFATIALARYITAVACRVYPPGRPIRVGGIAVARSKVRTLPGGSPTGSAESSSLLLRTGRSPQVALHLPSRERSYHFRIQAGNVNLEGTRTLLFKRLHRRTRTGILPVFSVHRLEARAAALMNNA